MRNTQNNLNAVASGMDRDTHPSRIKEHSYTFAKNISLEDSSGNGYPIVQNEPSNLLCQNFKEEFNSKGLGDAKDFKVVGFRYNSSLQRTYFFFTNVNKDSEQYKTSVIGYISKNVSEFKSEDYDAECGCINMKVLDSPLEGKEQTPLCEFTIIADDRCNKCLNLSIDNPIFERNIRFKNEQCGRRMYWTDRNNPPRYLDLDLIEDKENKDNIYFHTGQVVCDTPLNYEETCLDCDKLRMIPLYEIPCITPVNISLGGSLKLGTYEFLVAYCDEEGNELSNYYSLTNPINLFDYNSPVLDQPDLAKTTSYAIELKVSNLDQDFHYYKVAVIQSTEVNGEESYFEEGIHPITDETVMYTSERNKKRTTLNKLFVRRPKIESVEQMIDSNGYLFLAGLKNKPVMNLQPIANLIGPFLKWGTVVAKEDFYKNGISASTHRSYMRDETYPLSFTLGLKDGTETNYVHLINRRPTDYDMAEMTRTVEFNDDEVKPLDPNNFNVASIIKGKSECGGNTRKYRWQFENTATVEGTSTLMPRCTTRAEKEDYINDLSTSGESDGVFKLSDIKTCSILDMTSDEGEEVNSLSGFKIKIGGDYRSNISYTDYLTSNLKRYYDPNDVLYNPTIIGFLDKDRYKEFGCSTTTSCNCIDTSFISEEVLVRDIDLNLNSENGVYNKNVEVQQISFVEAQFPEGVRDEDYRLTSRFVLPDYGSIHGRPTRNYGNSCLEAYELESYADIVPDLTEGFVLPIEGNRDDSGYMNLCLPLYKSQGTDRRNHAISAQYVDGGAVYRPKKTHTRYASEIWSILRGEYFFPSFISKTALWLETKDISVDNIIQITPSSVKVKTYSNNTNELSSSQFLAAENDVAYNKLKQVRVSIFDSCNLGTTPKEPLKVLFLDFELIHLLDLKEELGLTSGRFYIAVDAPMVNLLHYKLTFTRQFNEVSDSYPDGQPTPEALRYVYKRTDNSRAFGYPSEFYYFPDINRDGAPQIGQVADYQTVKNRLISFDELNMYKNSTPRPSDDLDNGAGDTDSDPTTTTTVTTETLDDGTIIKTTVFTDSNGVVTTTIETTYTTGEVTTDTVESGGTFLSSSNYHLEDVDSYVTTSTDWSFLVVHRGFELEYAEYDVNELTSYKVQTYHTDCYYEEPDICEGTFFEEGKFAYTESTELYPDNAELYDSSRLNITEDMVDRVLSKSGWNGKVFENEDFKDVFVNNFGIKGSNGNIIEFFSPTKTNFVCTPIRHFKFPDNSVSPFIYTNENMDHQSSLIFPIGVSIDREMINVFLDLAVETGLISQEQRDEVVSFNLKRGDRTLEKTVLSRGLLTDVIKYKDIDGDRYFPNFPYNDLGINSLINNINGTALNHPYAGKFNNKFVFNSPEVDYNLNVTPSEITIDGFQYGKSESQLNIVKDHPKMVILTQEAINTADSLAKTESTFEVLSQVGELGIGAAQASSGGGFLGISGVIAGGVAAGFVAAVAALRVPMIKDRTAELRNKWIEIFKNRGLGTNFAHYITGVGNYNNFSTSVNDNSRLRRVVKSALMKEGVYNIAQPSEGGVMKVNNIDREKSLFLYLGNKPSIDGLIYTPEYNSYDNSSSEIPEGIIRAPYSKRIANLYASIKTWKADQYGKLENIKWIDVGQCVSLVENLEEPLVLFGGDTFISKYAYKRKYNYFLVSNMDQADFTPFKYSNYFNVGKPKYYIDYETEAQAYGKSIITTPSTTYNIYNPEEKKNYVTGGMFFHYNYGIPYFFVESTINCWNRYSGGEHWQNFYPNVSDYVEWTQESVVSIRKPNVLNYNYSYSKSGTPKVGNFLPNNFVEKFYNCTNNSPNGIMYSSVDNSEKQKVDPWLVYKNFDYYNFSASNGKLIDLVNIESTQILGIFENQVSLFNSIDTLKERVSPETAELGTGGIFAQRPLDFHRSELGYGGSQHKTSVSCDFGHFWVDAKRGFVYQVEPNGTNLNEITQGMRNWFKEHLPFKILKGSISNLSDLDLDNPFKGIGITMGWDSRYKRLFLTKLDYVVKPTYVGKLEFVAREGKEEADVNLDFLSVNKYIRVKDIEGLKYSGEEIDFSNTDVFTPAHFTLAYSPLFKTWISYYDFTPNAFISYENNFATLITDDNGSSLWSHLLTNKSFGVFYGKKYPWKVEIPTTEQYTQKYLSNVEFWLDTIRYQNSYDFALDTTRSLDSVFIYNNSNSSGRLTLIPRQMNNRYQMTQYPRLTNNSSEILVTFDEGKWSFNDFFNRVQKDNSNVPLWNYDINMVDKVENSKATSYSQRWLDRLRGDWFLIRFEGGSDTRFKQILKWVLSKDNIVM